MEGSFAGTSPFPASARYECGGASPRCRAQVRRARCDLRLRPDLRRPRPALIALVAISPRTATCASGRCLRQCDAPATHIGHHRIRWTSRSLSVFALHGGATAERTLAVVLDPYDDVDTLKRRRRLPARGTPSATRLASGRLTGHDAVHAARPRLARQVAARPVVVPPETACRAPS